MVKGDQMKKRFIVLGVILVLFILSSPIYAQKRGKLGQAGLTFLDIPVGPRATGMGNAYICVGNDANAVFWNPAGIAFVSNREIVGNHTSWIADINHLSGAFVYNSGKYGVFGISFITMDYGKMIGTRVAFTEEGYENIGDLSPSEFAVGIAYARQVTDKFSFGIHGKYVNQDLGKSITGYMIADTNTVENSISEFAFDFGTIFYTGFKDLRIAMSTRNFSREVSYRLESFPLPLTFSFGAAMNILSFFDMEDHTLTLAIDAIHPRDYPERINSGLEYWFRDIFAIRAGYKFGTDEEGYTLGLGLKQGVGMIKFKIDYSFSDFGHFDPVHMISIGTLF